MEVRNPTLLNLLLDTPGPSTHSTTPHIQCTSIDGLKNPVFIIESIIKQSPADVIGMVREFDLTPLAGQLLQHQNPVLPKSSPGNNNNNNNNKNPPHFYRCARYVSKMPVPYWPRAFDIESWFLNPPKGMDCCFVSQSLLPSSSPAVVAEAAPVGNVVTGQVHFSGYLLAKIGHDGQQQQQHQTWLRRVICVDLKCFLTNPTNYLGKTLLKINYEQNASWMNNASEDTIKDIQERTMKDFAYASLLQLSRD